MSPNGQQQPLYVNPLVAGSGRRAMMVIMVSGCGQMEAVGIILTGIQDSQMIGMEMMTVCSNTKIPKPTRGITVNGTISRVLIRIIHFVALRQCLLIPLHHRLHRLGQIRMALSSALTP